MSVIKRYEYYSKDGKRFTDWFNVIVFASRKECEDFIKRQPKSPYNLKIEYKIVEDVEP